MSAQLTVRQILEGDGFLRAVQSTLGTDAKSVQRFRQLALTAALSPVVRGCNPQSVATELLKLAAARLVPDGRQAALVSYKGTAKAIVMYAGLLDRIRASSDIQEIYAEVVREGDVFEFERGSEPKLRHVPNLGGDGAILGAYAFVRFSAMAWDVEWMPKSEIDQARAVSAAAAGGPWSKWYGEMAKKTVLRRLAKRLPLEDISSVLSADNESYDMGSGEPVRSTVGQQIEVVSGKLAEPDRGSTVGSPVEVVVDEQPQMPETTPPPKRGPGRPRKQEAEAVAEPPAEEAPSDAAQSEMEGW